MKKIGPRALENRVGDAVSLWYHRGAGKYQWFKNALLDCDDGGEFQIRDAEYREFSIPLKHGSVISFPGSKDARSYVFIDESD